MKKRHYGISTRMAPFYIVVVALVGVLITELICGWRVVDLLKGSTDGENKDNSAKFEIETPRSDEAPNRPTTNQEADTLPVDGSELTISFLDVGQADAALISCDGEYLMIDGGNEADSDYIYSYLTSHGVTYLNTVICTHSDEDHCGGLSAALTACDVGTAYCSVTEHDTKAFTNFVKKTQERGKNITIPNVGDTFNVGLAKVEVLGPMKKYDESNNNSIVVMLTFGENKFLFTGDAEYDAETDILDTGRDLSADVLKVGHHGSSSSTGYRWLNEVMPTYAVISVGEGNSYGHPSENTISRLNDADCTIYRTDECGEITCVSDGINITFSTEK